MQIRNASTSLALALLLILVAACSQPQATEPELTASPAPTTPVAATATARPSAEPAVSADATESPSPVVGDGPIEVGDWVMTTVDRLKLRTTPGLDSDFTWLLGLGATGTVIDGPTDAEGHRWYQLAWAGLPYGSGCLATPAGTVIEGCWPAGWVAGADTDGDPWLGHAPLQCPPRPTEVVESAALQPGVAFQCFGGQELRLRGYLAPASEGRGCLPGYDVVPEMFHPCAFVIVDGEATEFDGSTPSISVLTHEDIGACGLDWRSSEACPLGAFAGRWVQLTGHYDDPQALACQATPWEDRGAPPGPAEVVYQCRVSFVVTGIEAAAAP